MFLLVEFREEVVDRVAVDEHAGGEVEFGFCPVAFDVEDGLDHLGDVDVKHIRRCTNDWSVLFVHLDQVIVVVPAHSFVEPVEVGKFCMNGMGVSVFHPSDLLRRTFERRYGTHLQRKAQGIFVRGESNARIACRKRCLSRHRFPGMLSEGMTEAWLEVGVGLPSL